MEDNIDESKAHFKRQELCVSLITLFLSFYKKEKDGQAKLEENINSNIIYITTK
jgi:hypothetical protein